MISLHTVHCIVGQPVPEFLEVKSVLGTVPVDVLVEVPGVGLLAPLDLDNFFLLFFPLPPFPDS